MFEGIQLLQKWVLNGSENPVYTVVGHSYGNNVYEILFKCSDETLLAKELSWVRENMTCIASGCGDLSCRQHPE